MFCLLVSPDPLRRALLFPGGSEPPTPKPAEGCHVAVDVPEDEDEKVVVIQCSSDGVEGEETTLASPSGHISPVCRVLIRAAFVAYTAFAAPALAATAVTRYGGGGLRALMVLLLVVLTIAALFMATVRVSQDEDREREEEQEEQEQEKGPNKC